MKILDTMLMHNGQAGITVGVIVKDVNGSAQVFGTIAAAKSEVDEWKRSTGFNIARGRIIQFAIHAERDGMKEALANLNPRRRKSRDSFQPIFAMGEYSGNDIRKGLFGSIRDIVRNVEKRRSLVRVRKQLASILPQAKTNISFVGTVDDVAEDDGVAVPDYFSRAARHL